MKKKSLLALIAAVAATTTLGAACTTPTPEPEEKCAHEKWTIKSDADLHWSECDACHEKKDYGVHKDADENGKCDVCEAPVEVPPAPEHVHDYKWGSDETKHWQDCVDGDSNNVSVGLHIFDDGKCDTCGYIQQVKITFNMHGVGNVEAQSVAYNGKAAKPADPVDSGYAFEGWFTDADYENEFDFDQTLTEDVVIHAKWSIKDVPGANEEHAHTIELATEEATQSFGDLTKLYFAYTASKAGRFEIRMPIGNSQKCSFTVNKDEDGTVYDGKGAVKVDLDAGETLVVAMIRPADLADTAKVGVYLSEVTNEALPESWAAGEYVSGGETFTLDIESHNVTWTYLGDNAISFNYVGGKFNRITFKSGMEYSAIMNEDGSLSVYRTSTLIGVYKFYNEADKIPLAKFAGTYKPVNDKAGNATEFAFDGENGGYYIDYGYTYKVTFGTYPSLFYEKSSTALFYGNYYVTLNLNENGEAESITVRYMENGAPVIYRRTGDMIPISLPISNNHLYTGAVYAIGDFYDQVRWGSYSAALVTISDYDPETNVYTVGGDSTVTKVKVEIQEDNSKIFKLYDAEDNLVDTLKIYKGADLSHMMPSASGETNVPVAVSDLERRQYYLVVEEAGWYKFDCGEDKVSVTRSITSSAYQGMSIGPDMDAIYLNAGVKVCFKFTGDLHDGLNIKVNNVGESGAPLGAVESKPWAITEVGDLKQDGRINGNKYYYTFTAPKAGTYMLSITDGGNGNYTFTVDGESFTATANNKYKTFTVADVTKSVKIVVTARSYSSYTLKFEEDCTTGNTITFDEDGKGTFSASGAYFYAELNKIPYASQLVIGKADGEEFDITVDGITSTVKTYTFNSAKLARGFILKLADNQKIDYAITFSEGSRLTPIEIKEVGAFMEDLSSNQVKYFKITAPEDTDCAISTTSYDGNLLHFIADGKEYGYTFDKASGEYVKLENTIYQLKKGQTVVIAVSCKDESAKYADYDLNVFYDYSQAQEIDVDSFNSGDKTSDGAFAAYKTIEVSKGDTNYHIAKTYGSAVTVTGYSKFSVVNSDTTIYAVAASNGIYQAVIPAGEDLYFKLTSDNAQTLTFVLAYAVGTEANPYEVTFTAGVSSTTSIAAKTTAAIKIPAYGTYVYSGTGSGALYVNGKPVAKGAIFTVNANDIVMYKASTASNIVFVLTISDEFEFGKYEYTVSGAKKTLTLTATTVVVDNKVYTLTSMSGNNYTFSNEDDSVTLTLSADAMKYGNNNLTYVPVFSKEAAQTYSGTVTTYGGWDSYNFSITLLQTGAVKVTSSAPCTVTGNAVDNGDGTYSFPFTRGSNKGTAKFSFGAGGVMTIDLSSAGAYDKDAVLTPETPWDPSAGGQEEKAELKAGTYTGKVGTTNITLVINADLTSAKHTSSDGTEADVTLTSTADGKYTYEVYVSMYWHPTYTLTVNADGTLTLHDGANNVDGTLVSEGSEESGLKAGTYTGKVGTTNITLVINADLASAKHTSSDGTEADVTLTSTADGKYTYEVYVSMYWHPTYTLTVNADGTLTLHDGANNVDGTLVFEDSEESGLKAGTYTGKVGTTNITLVINADLASAKHISSDGTEADVTLTSTADGKYTYEVYVSMYWHPTYTLTVNADGTLTLHDGANNVDGTLTFEEPAVVELKAGTYKAKIENTTYIFTINADLKTADYTLHEDGEAATTDTVNLSNDNGKWSFILWDMSIPITVNGDGSISFEDMGQLITLSPSDDEEEPPVAATLQAGTYKGVDVTLSISDDLTTVTYTYEAGEDSVGGANLALTENNGTYTFTYLDFGEVNTCTFTVNADGSLTFSDSWYIPLSITLTSTAK